MKKAKHVLIGIVVVLVVIIAFQNTAAVDTQLLFATVTMPRALLIVVTLVIGFALGLLTAMKVGPSRKDRPVP